MNLEALRTLVVAAELQNFHAVSRRLNMSQPAIAKRIRVLEEAFNTKLFVRSGKRMLLTHDGRLALAHAKRIVRNYDRMCDSIGKKSDTTTIRLGVVDTILSTWLSDFLAKHREEHPDVGFEISSSPTTSLIEDLHHSRIDMAFVLGPSEDRPYVDVPLGFMEVGLYCGPKSIDALRARELTPEVISEQNFVTFPRNSKPHIRLIEFLNSMGLPKPPVITNCASVLTMRSMAERDIGIATIPKLITQGAELFEIELGTELVGLSFSATYDPTMVTDEIKDACETAARVAKGFMI